MYSANELNGEKISYYPSGIVKEKGSFVKDKKHGFWFKYDTVGYQIERVQYKNGIKK